jgi:hypothetical protein
MSFLDFLRSGKIAIDDRVGHRKKGVIESAPVTDDNHQQAILANQERWSMRSERLHSIDDEAAWNDRYGRRADPSAIRGLKEPVHSIRRSPYTAFHKV